MRIVLLLVVLMSLSISCKQQIVEERPAENKTELVQVADNIIYDVIIRAESNDPWEIEKIEGFDGKIMIDRLFEGLYNNTLLARDYYTGEELSASNIRKIERTADYERSNIGKIQFTEDWYFNPQSLEIEKEILTIVFGYKTGSDDNAGVGYMAAFKIEL